MIKFLTVFIYIWVGLFISLNILGVLTQFYMYGFSEGLSYIWKIYSPFNIVNYIFMIVSLLPAIGAYIYMDKLKENR